MQKAKESQAGQPGWRRPWKIILNVVVSILVLALGYGLFWLRPLSATEPSLSAMQSGHGVTVTTAADLISFLPASPTQTGFIFYPGALVDPRAYASDMHSFAEQGYTSFIVKMPYNIAFLGQDRAADIIQAHPEIKNWGIGGHSLGGVSASTFAASHHEIKGLLLYASYPASDISQQMKNKVVYSVSGTNDGLATPTKIKQNKPLLPSNTQYFAIPGGIHAFFGDYGPQSGDGQPTVSRAEAQQLITSISLEFLGQLKTGATAKRNPSKAFAEKY